MSRTSRGGGGSLIAAAASGNAALVARLSLAVPANYKLQPPDPSATDAAGRTALHHAVINNRFEVLPLLLVSGAAVLDRPDQSGRTPLHWAVEKSHYRCMELLIEEGADLEARDSSGRTVAHRAAARGDDDALELVLAAGAAIDAQDWKGRSPMWAAAKGGRDCTGCLTMLLKGRRDKPVAGADGGAATVTSVAFADGAGADINQQDRRGTTLFSECVKNNDPSLLHRIASCSASEMNLDLADNAHRTAMDHAVYSQHPECARVLADNRGRMYQRHATFAQSQLGLPAKHTKPSAKARRKEHRKNQLVKMLTPLRFKLRAASYRAGGQDWPKLFYNYDVNRDGTLSLGELHAAVRKDLKLPPREVSNTQIEQFFKLLDEDGSGDLDLDEVVAFIRDSTWVPSDERIQGALGLKASQSLASLSQSRSGATLGGRPHSPSETGELDFVAPAGGGFRANANAGQLTLTRASSIPDFAHWTTQRTEMEMTWRSKKKGSGRVY